MLKGEQKKKVILYNTFNFLVGDDHVDNTREFSLEEAGDDSDERALSVTLVDRLLEKLQTFKEHLE